MEDRVKKLEIEVVNLRIEHAEINSTLTSLKEAVNELRDGAAALGEVVQDLRDTMNKGRGVIWIFGIGAAALGGIISAALKKLLV